MAEEQKEEVKTPAATAETNYIDTIKKLKETSVPRADYDKLVQENKQLLDSLTQFPTGTQEKPAEKPKVDVDKLRQELYGPKSDDLSNLDYISKTLELRKALMDRGESDPFVGRGEKLAPTDEDYRSAEKVAKVLQECVDSSEGDSGVFTAQLQSKIVDIPLPRRKH